jgi:glutaredoxin-related protein
MIEEKEHILDVLKGVDSALKTNDAGAINRLSNEVIHHSSIHQDTDIISVAVIVYALSKLIEREDLKKYSNWNTFYNSYIKGIKKSINALEENKIDSFRKEIKKLRKDVEKISGKLKPYIQDVFEKAQINKASKIYEHGISMEKTAKILGVTVWELAEYSGQKQQDAGFTTTMPIKQRIKIAEEVFQ